MPPVEKGRPSLELLRRQAKTLTAWRLWQQPAEEMRQRQKSLRNIYYMAINFNRNFRAAIQAPQTI
jgi:hypothetical protein